MNWYVYILKSIKTNQYYKGLTNNIDIRLIQHDKGLVRFTKNKRPLKLIHVQICNSRMEARKLEIFFKLGFGREIIKEI